eukprot:11641116-Alexandrium_andersonii.AAC.1
MFPLSHWLDQLRAVLILLVRALSGAAERPQRLQRVFFAKLDEDAAESQQKWHEEMGRWRSSTITRDAL